MNKRMLIVVVLVTGSSFALRKKGKDIPYVSRVMVFAPHPDDDILGCGGVLTKHVNDGTSCSIIFITSGEAPGNKKDKEAFAQQREEEARKGAERLGVTDLVFLKEPDGKLAVRSETIERVAAVMQSYEPELVYVPHAHDAHRDHRATYTIVIEAVKRLKKRPKVLAYEVWTPLQTVTHIAPLSEETMRVKLEALSEHRSQVKSINFADAISSLNRYRGILMCRTAYAECFRLITIENS